jgi:polar amino acid transport system substrate-binding protein
MKKQVAIYGLLMAALLALSACSAVQQAATSGGEAPAAAGKLGEIQAAGKLVVGTSADYPPYESIDADGNFVGFDMDLMRAIGEQLGVEVEFQDMPFDTLIASVQEGKIDAIIAAMQATAERDEQVDFTIPYRMTKDAFIGAGDTAIVINTAEDAAGKSIGAQTGTVQERWIQEKLVAAGLTSADQVAEPAMALAEQNGLKVLLVTETTAEGGKSIAILDGETAFKAELDRIIQALIDDGTVQQIQEANGLP